MQRVRDAPLLEELHRHVLLLPNILVICGTRPARHFVTPFGHSAARRLTEAILRIIPSSPNI